MPSPGFEPRPSGPAVSVTNHYIGWAAGIMVLGGIEFHCHTPLVRIARTLNNQLYISEVLEPMTLPYIQRFPSAIFHQENARPHVTRNVQEFFFIRQIELLPWTAYSPDLLPIENLWSMLAQRLARDTPPPHTHTA
ncbi:transposable element Tcb1 transposase [Trichonephila clavipes]|uniref:Transposable element Tcb1 transposase n=1 Tax=Trichonephila clavipes TaxID=2585209 RepID=A0A8X6WA95_TRICX|nr:transposable element Tcb1 transposase [Trichonephila clavipes]